MSRLMSKEDFARSQGFSSAYLRHLVRIGRVIPVDGKIDTDQAGTVLEAHRTPRMQKRKGIPQEVDFDDEEEELSAKERKQLGKLKSSVTSATELSTILLKTRIKNEVEKGKLLEVEAKVKTGQYVDAQAVDKEAFQVARTVRDALQNIFDRVAHLRTSLSDANPIYDILAKEIRTVLEALADRLETKE